MNLNKINRRVTLLVIAFFVFFLSSCSNKPEEVPQKEKTIIKEATVEETTVKEPEIKLIDAKTAKSIMDTEDNYIILDVRTQEEYDSGHIANSVLLPHDQIGQLASELLPDKDQKILIYCRSGNRSGQASRELLKLGYTQIYDFGGIIDWPYDIEK
jgi:phage shock protein E